MKLHITLNGKWSEKVPVGSIEETVGDRTPISGLLRILKADSDATGFIERLAHRTENSVLDRPESATLPRYMAGGRTRLATCTGVSWFRERYLAVANFYGGHLRIYELHGNLDRGTDLRLEKIHHQDHAFAQPEDCAVSPNGTLAAVTHAPPGKAMTTLHRLDQKTMQVMPYHQTLRKGAIPHGITFTPDSRFLIFTEILTGSVQVFDVSQRKAKLNQTFIAPVSPLTPKSVAISPDGRFAAIVHANEIKKGQESLSGCRFSVYRFDSEMGYIHEDPIAIYTASAGIESCTFVKQIDDDSYELAACDQGTDQVSFFHLNVKTSSLECIECHPGVSFPHGIDSNPSGTRIAVTCYGDDTLRIFDVPSRSQRAIEAVRPHALICCPDPYSDKNSAAVSSILASVNDLRTRGFHITFLVANKSSVERISSLADRVIQLDFEDSNSTTENREPNITTIHSYLLQQNVVLIEATEKFGIEAIEAGQRADIPTALHQAQQTLGNENDAANSDRKTERGLADFLIRDKRQTSNKSQSDVHAAIPAISSVDANSITAQEFHQKFSAERLTP
ncbi:MAG: SMP-30/gluconolactonase/LRE family protein [Pirellulaceae bacterium]|nr:SMP-30/gluconolactonase/LRE family protein [Pirellulaceae bacterium]